MTPAAGASPVNHRHPSDATAQRTGGNDTEQRTPRRKARRRATYINEVDQRLVELGLEPSWEQKVSDADRSLARSRTTAEDHTTEHAGGSGSGEANSNDQRLAENVPPHSHVRP